jgi:hypothetical protein
MSPSRRSLQPLARFGYGARGGVYLVVGGLAAASAVGAGGKAADGEGALATLLGEPFGLTLVAVAAAGLLAFAFWRFLQAAWDADRHGTDAKGAVIRAGLLVSGVIHLGLAASAAGLVLGWGTGGDGTREWTARLMGHPFGALAVGAAGAATAVAGIAIAMRGWTGAFRRRLMLDGAAKRWVEPLGRYGLAARGGVLALVGGFLVAAAWQADPGEARGLGGALEALRAQSYGGFLFGLAAFGLLAFGLYGLAQAAYRRVEDP